MLKFKLAYQLAMVRYLFILFFIHFSFNSFGQTITRDTLLARQYFEMGDSILESRSNHDSSIYYFEKAAEVYQKHKLMENYYSCQNKVAENLWRSGRNDESVKLSVSIVEKLRDIGGVENAVLGDSYYGIGIVNINQGNYEKALEYIQKSMDIWAKALGEKHPKVGDSYNVMGFLNMRQGNYEKALELFQKSLDIRVKALGEEHLKVGASYNNIGWAYKNQGNYKMALEFFQKSGEIKVKSLGEEHSDMRYFYVNMGDVYRIQANYKMALEFFQKSLDVSVRALGEEHPAVGASYNLMGTVYSLQANYEKAQELFQKSLDIRIKVFGEEHPLVGDCYNNMGIGYMKQGNYEKALEFFQKSREIKVKSLGEEHPDLGRTYNNMGDVYRIQANYKMALEFYQKGLDIWAKSLGEEHPDMRHFHINMGRVYMKQGNYEKALELFQKSLDISVRSLGEEHPAVGSSYNNIGEVLFIIGRINESGDYLEKADQIMESKLGSNHPDYYGNLASQAVFYYVTDKPDQAISNFKIINSFYIGYIDRVFDNLGESEREKFYGTLLDYFETFQNFTIKNPSVSGDLFNLQLVTKSILLSSFNQIKRRILNSGDSIMIHFFDEVQEIKQELGKYYQLGNDEKESSGINLDSINSSYEEMDRQLSKYASFYATDKEEYTWQDVQAKLNKGEAAIEIIRMRNYIFSKMKFGDSVFYAALIVTPETKHLPELVVLKNGVNLEDKYINAYRNSIYLKIEDKLSYQQYWEPIKEKLKGIKTVYFSPDGVYNLINLPTLYNADKDTYLFEEINIKPVTSTRDLLGEVREPMPNNFSIIMGNPDFGESEDQRDERDERTLTSASMQRSGISPLPGTAKEVDLISELFEEKGWRQQQLTQDEASEDKLKTMLKPKVLHIATHGFFEEDVDKITYLTNPLYRSGLLFTGAEETLQNQESIRANILEGKEDGILTAFEAMNLNIDNTELVVLSACETGLGEIRNGEGVYGLQRAFKVAGAKTILTSLWKVDDNVTQELMVSFYENWLGGMTKREAFKKAQTTIKVKYPHPYYWGAFIMVGE